MKRHPSPGKKQTPSKTLKNSSKEKKYTDYLFDEMVNEEKRQSIDVDKILLPTRLPEASSSGSSSRKQAMEDSKNRDLSKTTDSSLEKRLEHIFGVDSKKTTNGNGLKAEIEKNNEKSKSSLAALEKDMAKINAVAKRDHHQSKKPSDEPYDPEKEYQSVDGKLKSNGTASSSRTRSQSNGKSKKSISPQKKVKKP